MVSGWWILVALWAGVIVGLLLAALVSANDDEKRK